MVILLCIVGLLFVHYTWLILQVSFHLPDKLQSALKKSNPQNGISIIIPFRNEIKVLNDTLKSLKANDYKRDDFEVLFVNDHSEDDFQSVFKHFEGGIDFKVLNNSGVGKKSAIDIGITNAKFKWILSTDADCSFDVNWLQKCSDLINSSSADLFVLPVFIGNGKRLLDKFQFYDSLSTMAFNQGYFFWKGKALLASGANLLYKKEDFELLQPYKTKKQPSSGDDMFLLQSFKENNRIISFSINPNIWVETIGEQSWVNCIDQRIRWAKKMRFLVNSNSFVFGLYMLSIQVALWIVLIASFKQPIMFYFFLGLIILKALSDYHLIKKVAKIKSLATHLIMMFVLEIVYMIIVPLIVLISIFRTPHWKGRKIKS